MAVSLEQEINKKLIENVQIHPCLYDSTSKFYSNIISKDVAWRKIANKIHLSERDCKERWRNIRSSYLRYLKSKSSGASSVTPYYLSEYMHFLKPFTKPKTQVALSTFENNNSERNSSVLLDQTETEPKESSTNVPTPSTSSSSVFYINARPQNEGSSLDVINQTVTDHSQSKNTETLIEKQEDPDLSFFKSLLPDFHTLPPAKKRRVKMEMMKLVDEACNEQEVPNILLSSPRSSTYGSTQNGNLEIIDDNASNFCQKINVKNE